MDVKIFKEIVDSKTKNELWEILIECDNEFYPPLSYRESLDSNNKVTLPYSYFTEMIDLSFVCVFQHQKLIAFMSFSNTNLCEELKKFEKSNYITTICVSHSSRGKGLTTIMYDYLINNISDKLYLPFITTRTWSLNTRHINVLKKLGFETVKILDNDRGNNIDTIYFAKSVSKKNNI